MHPATSYTDATCPPRTVHVSFILGSILAFAFTILLHLPHEISDEGFHSPQIWGFYNGDLHVARSLTMLPAYHAVIAALLKATGIFSVKLARFLHLLLCALTLPVFYRICKALGRPHPDSRTLLFLTCPIILPFFALLYTDVPALLPILLQVLSTIRKRHLPAALFGLVATLVRQTSIVWVAFSCVYVVIEQVQAQGTSSWRQHVLPLARRLWAYAAVGLGAAVFFHVQGGVAVGDSSHHPISFNPSNLYLFLLLAFLFFLPHNLARAGAILDLLRRRPRIWYILVPAFVGYMATYSNAHPYNSAGLSFYLRNVLLHHIVTRPAIRALTFIPVAWMALTLILFFHEETRHRWSLGALYVFALLSFVPLPLVEQRYYLPALTLLFAFAPLQEARLNWTSLWLFVPVNCVLLLGISNQWFFL